MSMRKALAMAQLGALMMGSYPSQENVRHKFSLDDISDKPQPPIGGKKKQGQYKPNQFKNHKRKSKRFK